MFINRSKPFVKQTILAGFLAGCFLIVFPVVKQAIAGPPDGPIKLNVAINNYKSAQYDEAIRLFSEIVESEAADIEHRKDALRYLGRCYVAKRQNNRARNTLKALLAFEPPVVNFDPDRESPPFMRVYYEARKDQSNGSYQLEHVDDGIKTIAVIDFQNSSVDHKKKYDPLEKGFADILINRLNGTTQLKVVERDRIQWILNELEIQNKYEMQGAIKAGEQLGVHAVILGSYIVVKKEIWLSARLVKVATSEVLLTQDIKGKVDDFFELTEKLSKKIAAAIDSQIKHESASIRKDSNSLEAMLSYSEGLVYLEKAEYERAYQKFIEALDHDPRYDRARMKAESVRHLVAYTEG